MSHEYLVVPAPRVAPRVKGVRSAPKRFALAVAEVMNEAGRDGWEYLRTDTLPMEARAGWFGGRTVTPQELLVFRRPLPGEGDADDLPRLRVPAFSHAGAAGRDAAREDAADEVGTDRDGADDDGPYRLRREGEEAPAGPVGRSPVPLRSPGGSSSDQGAAPRVGPSPFGRERAEAAPPAPRPGPNGPGGGRPRLGGARRD